jgi:hypothetical protein
MDKVDITTLTPMSEAERDTVCGVTHLVLRETAPAELVIFDQVADEYFADPAAALSSQSREEAIGFGLDLALVTPVVLAAVTGVVRFLSALVADAVQDEASAEVARRVRRLFGPARDGAVRTLDVEHVRRVRDVARSQAIAFGMPATDAGLLADAIVGRLQTAQ